MSDSEFDTFAFKYKDILDETVGFSGETSAYFDSYKLHCLQRWCIAPKTDRAILDFGCGTGSLAALVADALPQAIVHGYDISEKSLKEARTKSAGRSNLTFFDRLPDESSYDLVYSANVFHHIPPNSRAGVLTSLGSLLAPGGRVAIFEHNPWNPLTRYVVKTCPFDKGVELICRPAFARMAGEAGLEITLRRYIVFFPSFLKFLRKHESRLGFLPFGAQYMLVLRKCGGN